MQFRALIAVLLALSLALLPAAASWAAPAPAKAGFSALADCDHHAHARGHTLPEKAPPAGGDCLPMASCGLCCATLTEIGAVALAHDFGLGTPIDSVDPGGLSLSWLAAPPLRPPRV